MQEANPKYYSKKIKIKPNILKTLPEEELNQKVDDINEAILTDFGKFGDLVELAREHLVSSMNIEDICASNLPRKAPPRPLQEESAADFDIYKPQI